MFARTDSPLAPEGGAESEGVAVSNLTSNVLQGVRCLTEEVSGQGKTPRGEEGHRRLADEIAEPARQPCARHAHRGSEARKRPGTFGIVLDQHQYPPDDRITLSAIPAGRHGVWAIEPSAEGRDEQQIKKPIKDRLLAELIFAHLRSEDVDQRPIGVGVADMDDRR